MVEDASDDEKLRKEKVVKVEPATEPEPVDALIDSSRLLQIIVKQETNKPAASESRQEAQTGKVAVEQVVRPEGRLLYTIIVKDELLHSTEKFTEFIRDLRDILADHLQHEDICDRHQDTNLSSSKTHPLLAKPRADQQPARMIQVKLEVVVEDNGTTKSTASTTLVMRDDNVDVVGFSNHKGDWYELGNNNRCRLPPEYNSVLLPNWGNSYKSILDVANEEEVMDKLTSESLGKTFATNAVRILSCYPTVAYPDGDNPSRLALVGLKFIISESARMNHVHGAIESGWDTGTGFSKQLMTDNVWKYVEMSRSLREWKLKDYAGPKPKSELDAIYLVLNEEYTIGHLLPFAYPEIMVKASSSREMFRLVSMATVQVNLQRLKQGQEHMGSVYGRIAAVVTRDKHMDNGDFRVGSMLLTRTKGMGKSCSNSQPLELARSIVAVPPGWVLQIVVDLHVKILGSDKKSKPLSAIFYFDKESETLEYSYKGLRVEVNIIWEDNKQYFPPQLISCPVEVYKTMCGHPSVVYTVGDDVMPFTEFIMTLRRILAAHKDREDILDGHDLLNLCSTGAHPVLAEQHTGIGNNKEPVRWLRIKLQVEGEEASSATLVMRYDNLYVHGFFNHNGTLFKLCEDNEDSIPLIPANYHPVSDTKHLKWGISYPSIVKVGRQNKEISAQLVEVLKDKKLSYVSAKDSVRSLSRFTGDDGSGDSLTTRKELVRLLLMVCEPSRMDPLHEAIAVGWTDGTEFTEQMLDDYVWKYKIMSQDLWRWKSEGYAKRVEWNSTRGESSQENEERQPISQLQAIYLVLRPPLKKKTPHQPPAKIKSNRDWRDQTSDGDNDAKSRQSQEANNQTREEDNGHSRDTNDHTSGDNSTQSQEANGGQTNGDNSTQSQEANGCQTSREEADHETSEEDDDETSEEEEDEDQGREADDIGGYGRPLVELLAISADLDVDGTTIMVLDGKRGQIIYRRKKDEQGAQQGIMADLLLTGPYTGISAFGCFAIKVDIPDTAANGSSGNASDPIEWEWDCYDPKFAAEVDNPQPVIRTISPSGPGPKVEVTYAVMSDALEATVQVKLRLKDGHSPGGASGKITALIDGFHVPSVLFSCSPTEEMSHQCFSPTNDDSWFLLQLARNVVAVPCGNNKVLHIQVDLHLHIIGTSDKQESKHLNATLDFKNGSPNQCYKFGEEEIGVDITWYPEVNTKLTGETEFIAAAPEQAGCKEDVNVGGQDQVITSVAPESSRSTSTSSCNNEDITTQQVIAAAPEESIDQIAPEPIQQVEIDMATAPPIHQPEQNISSSVTEAYFPGKVEMKKVDGHQTLVYTIGDFPTSFTEFISHLRDMIADHLDREDIMDRRCQQQQQQQKQQQQQQHPLLAKRRVGEQPARWLHIKLQVADVYPGMMMMWTTTLVLRDDDLHVQGFRNQKGDWFEIGGERYPRVLRRRAKLPPEYRSTLVRRGFNYRSLLKARNQEEVADKLYGATPDKYYMEAAVRALSCYPYQLPIPIVLNLELDLKHMWAALAVLRIMVCGSARFHRVGRFKQLMDYSDHWFEISSALLDWRDRGYDGWPQNSRLASIGITKPEEALDVVCLVLNDPARTVQPKAFARMGQRLRKYSKRQKPVAASRGYTCGLLHHGCCAGGMDAAATGGV